VANGVRVCTLQMVYACVHCTVSELWRLDGTRTQSPACLTVTVSAITKQPEARSTLAVMSDVSEDTLVFTSTVTITTWVHYTHSQNHHLRTISQQLNSQHHLLDKRLPIEAKYQVRHSFE